jgi:hypothetical protein
MMDENDPVYRRYKKAMRSLDPAQDLPWLAFWFLMGGIVGFALGTWL